MTIARKKGNTFAAAIQNSGILVETAGKKRYNKDIRVTGRAGTFVRGARETRFY